MDCLFCKIIKREISAEIIYEDGETLGILDVNPVADGHSMILPKVHVETILDLPEEKIGPVFGAVKNLTGILKKSLAPDAFTIGINNGRAAGQAIDHLHIHIIPRYKDDGGGSVHGIVRGGRREPLQATKEKILKIYGDNGGS